MSGLEFLAALRADFGTPSKIPVVMLTGMASEQVAVDAMKAGAQDYLVKDRITGPGLSLAIQKAIEKMGLIKALEEERDRLARSLAEKEVLLREVHHRVKNNLQVIASLLRLQAEAFDDHRLTGALMESQQRVASMALIHEQLYESEDLREVDLAQHAAMLLHNLSLAYGGESGRVNGEVRLEPLALGVDQAIPAGLILNELISNALKHAFPDRRSGSISISGGAGNGHVTVEVQDDGIGLPRSFDMNQTTSLGLRIVQILARQLKGTLEVETANGTRFRVTFPRAVEKNNAR